MELRLETEEERIEYEAERERMERIGTTTEDGKWVIACPDCERLIRSFGLGSRGRSHCTMCKGDKIITVDPIETREFCRIEDHTWYIEFEGGSFNVRPKDPHTPVECEAMRRHDPEQYPVTGCEAGADIQELLAGDYEVKIRGVDDSTSAGPWGPAEYDYYFEIAEFVNV